MNQYLSNLARITINKWNKTNTRTDENFCDFKMKNSSKKGMKNTRGTVKLINRKLTDNAIAKNEKKRQTDKQ